MQQIDKYIFSLIILLNIELSFPQAWELIGGPTGTTPNDVIFTHNEKLLCSTVKGVFISDDYGNTWRISISSLSFKGIYSLTERLNGEILAIERFGILKSTDGGENWFKVSNMSYLNDYGAKIYESPTDSSLYFSKSKLLYKSTNGGFDWEVIWQGEVIDGFIVNELGWIYLSQRYKNILISKDNGVTFSPYSVGIDLSYSIVSYMYSDKHTGLYFRIFQYPDWIVHFGNNKLTYIENGWTNLPLGVNSSGDLIYRSGNCIKLFELSTKQSRTISCPDFVKDQFAKNVITKENIWVANFNYLGLHRSNDSGKTWKNINNGLGFTESTAMQITKNGKFIVSAFSGAFWGNLYHSTDDGKTWWQKNPVMDPVFYDIEAAVNGNLIATGSYGIFTADSEGENWVQRKDTEIASYLFVSKNGIVFTGTRPDGMLYSRNNGISWSRPSGLGSLYFSSFGESTEGRLFASAESYTEGIYYSDNEGRNWSHVNPFPYSGVYDFITKRDSVYAATNSGIYKSIDNGLNWTYLSYEIIRKFELAPNGDLIGIKQGRDIIKSSDNGKSWEILGEGLKGRAIRDICFDVDYQIYALTDSGIFRNNLYIYPFIVKPYNGASNLPPTVQFEWSKVSTAYNYELELYEDSLLNSTIKIIATTENYATVNSFLFEKTYFWRVKAYTTKFDFLYSNVGKFSIAPPFSITQNYPNPFNAETKIEFYVPYESRIKLKVYNILGEVVENLIDSEYSEGKYTHRWNASSFPSGIYFIQIEGDEFRQIKKAVLIK